MPRPALALTPYPVERTTIELSHRVSPSIRLVTGLVLTTVVIGVTTPLTSATASPTCPTGSVATSGQDYCTAVFDTSDAQWVVPTGVTSIDILVVGAGGAGGAANGYNAGGGGGGGQVEVFTNEPVTPGESVSVNVGTGGGVRASGLWGGSGGNSSVNDAASAYTARGGSGGYAGQAVGPNPNSMQDGGRSGNDYLGGAGIPSTTAASYNGALYPLAGGGGGAGGPGQSAAAANNDSSLSDADFVAAMDTINSPMSSGAGGPGVVPTDGLFAGSTTAYGIGGGGGAQTLTSDVNTHEYNDLPGQETGGSTGAWGNSQGDLSVDATTVLANSGGGGGGGASIGFAYQGQTANAASGANGLVEIRFVPAAPRVITPPPTVKHHPSANIYFGLDKTTLSPAAVKVLGAYVLEIVKDHVTHVSISGFADKQGALAHNEWLSKTRASVVAGFIRAALAKAGDHKVAVTESGKGVLKSGASYQLDRVVAITSK